MNDIQNEKYLRASDVELVKFDETVFESFKVFLDQLTDLVAQNRYHGVTAIQPESWKNMMYFTRWAGRIQFEAKLSKALEDLGLTILDDWYGQEGGIVLPVFVPRSIFTSFQETESSHQVSQ